MDQSNGPQPARGGQSDRVYELFILVIVASTMLMVATDYLPFVSGPTKQGLRWLSVYVGTGTHDGELASYLAHSFLPNTLAKRYRWNWTSLMW